jgi:hypothetical protein
VNLRPAAVTYYYSPRPTHTCSRCQRTGRVNFVLVDRYADGSEEWRCAGRQACRSRAKSLLLHECAVPFSKPMRIDPE